MVEVLWQNVLEGMVMGAVYGLLALGVVLVYNSSRTFNLIQGEFVMLGGMFSASFYSWMPIWLAGLAALAAMALVGLFVYRLILYPVRHASHLTVALLLFAVSIVISGMAMVGWGTDPKILPAFTSGSSLTLWGASVARQSLWVIGTVLVIVAALFAFLNWTLRGKAMRAAAVDDLAARLMGIRAERISLISFTLAAALGAAGGIVISPLTSSAFDSGMSFTLKGFTAALVGGLHSPGGAVLGGVTLGILEAVGAGLISSRFKDAIALALLILILAIRPAGLLGKAEPAHG